MDELNKYFIELLGREFDVKKDDIIYDYYLKNGISWKIKQKIILSEEREKLLYNNEIYSVRELKNMYKGKDIYIIGSGASCNYIDASFFKNKITIGINQVYIKYKCDFLIKKDNIFIDNIIDFLKSNNLNTKIILSQYDGGVPWKETNLDLNLLKKRNIYYFNHLINQNEKSIDYSNYDNDDMLLVGWSTLISALHLSCFLGCSNIILVGCDEVSINNKLNFDEYDELKKSTLDKNGNYAPNTNSNQYSSYVSNKLLTNLHEECINFLKDKYKINVHSINPFYNLKFDKVKLSYKKDVNNVKKIRFDNELSMLDSYVNVNTITNFLKDDVRFYPDDSINEDDWFYNKENIEIYLSEIGYIKLKDDIQLKNIEKSLLIIIIDKKFKKINNLDYYLNKFDYIHIHHDKNSEYEWYKFDNKNITYYEYEDEYDIFNTYNTLDISYCMIISNKIKISNHSYLKSLISECKDYHGNCIGSFEYLFNNFFSINVNLCVLKGKETIIQFNKILKDIKNAKLDNKKYKLLNLELSRLLNKNIVLKNLKIYLMLIFIRLIHFIA